MCGRQSQKHGFIFENDIRKNVFQLEEHPNNTDIHDINCEQNKFNNSENISIKSTSSSNIDCGDILRFFNYDFSKTNTIILVQYIQQGNLKVIKNIYEINYTKEMHKELFGSISRTELENYIKQIKSIAPGKCDKVIRKDYIEKKKQLQSEYNMRINISPKVDSKSQRRVQCSIPKFTERIKKFIISHSTEGIIRDKQLKNIIHSPKRNRNTSK